MIKTCTKTYHLCTQNSVWCTLAHALVHKKLSCVAAFLPCTVVCVTYGLLNAPAAPPSGQCLRLCLLASLCRCQVTGNIHLAGAVVRITDGLALTSFRSSSFSSNTATALLRFEGRTWVLNTTAFFTATQFLDVLYYTEYEGSSQAAYNYMEKLHAQYVVSETHFCMLLQRQLTALMQLCGILQHWGAAMRAVLLCNTKASQGLHVSCKALMPAQSS